MITDPLFYRLFERSPETLFLLFGMTPESAAALAARYRFQAIEFKETSHRTDGVLLPNDPDLAVYFLEVQFYFLPSVFADLLAKAYTYLKQNDPGQTFCGVVLFADRSLEPTKLAPYQALIDAGVVRRFYLDELPNVANAPLGMSILTLLRESEEQAPSVARNLIARAKSETDDEALRADLIELIETVIIYKIPRLSREEIQTMLQVHDIRETRVFQEGVEEGIEKGIEKGIAIAISRMAAKPMAPEEIAAILNLDLQLVRKALGQSDGN